MLLIKNTPDAPAELPANMSQSERQSYAGSCPSVTKNFLNKNSCVRMPSCAPLSFSSTRIPLNQTTLRLWCV